MGGRPAKSAGIKTGKSGNQENLDRENTEKKLRGKLAELEPAYKLTPRQRKIFLRIRRILLNAEVLGELDAYILTITAVSLDRIQEIDERVNADPELLLDKDALGIRDKYMSHYMRCCSELCMSPQSRAKMGIVAAQNGQRREDALAKILADDDD